MRNFRLYGNWLKGLYGYLLTGVLFIIVITYTRTWIPLFFAHVLDSILGDKESFLPVYFSQIIGEGSIQRQLLNTALLIIVISIIRGLIIFLEGRQVAHLAEKMAFNIRVKLYEHIQNLPYSYHNNAETGDLIQRSTSDVDTVRRFISSQLPELLRSILLFVFMFSAMLRLHVTLAFISIFVLPIIFVFALFYFKRVQKLFTETEESESKMSTTLQENLTGIRVVKAFANEAYEINKFDRDSRVFTNNSRKIIDNMAYYWATSDLICFLQIVATVAFGSYYAIEGQITTGVLVVFVSYVQAVLWPIRNLGRIIAEMGKSGIALRRIQEILDVEVEHNPNENKTPEITGAIEFKDTSFLFEDSNSPVLENINLKIQPGQTVAILGRTGSGKSTLVNILVRLLDYSSGSIKVDGVELKEIDKKWIRKHIGLILQEPFLYAKTVYDNIGILNKDLDEKKVKNAAKTACVHKDIEQFEKGYQTMVGERGVTLSGGQKQRVAIARMLTEQKPILIFDDSLSAVDTETDISIRTALSRFSNDVTKIIITHRVSTAMDADLIVILDHGKITESGTHEELLANQGLYHRVWEIQNSDSFMDFDGGEEHA